MVFVVHEMRGLLSGRWTGNEESLNFNHVPKPAYDKK
jgi:hypothetical protein